MARRITINLSDTINTWRIKTNTLSTLIGDLDLLSSEFTNHDSDFVEAINWAFYNRRQYTAGLGISKSTSGDSSGAFTVLAGNGLTQDANGLSISSGALENAMLGSMPANTIKVRDANSAGVLSDKEVTDQQILIGNGNGFTSAALSQDVLMTNNGVVTIQPDVVTYSKMQNVVGANKVLGSSTANGIITETQVQTGMIADDAVTTVKILDDNVTYAKIQDASANSILVRDGAAAGDISAKTLTDTQILINNGAGFTAAALSGDVTMTNTGAVTIESDVVTYDKMQDASANSILVRDGATVGDISAKVLTDTQILINNGAGFTAATLSGDVTMTNAGVITVDPSIVGTVRLGGTAPTSPSNGHAWFDDVTTGEMFVYSDSASNWIQVTGSITSFSAIGATPPTAPLNGTFWFDDSATGELFIYSDGASNWIQVTGVVANVAFSDLTSTPTTLAGYGITDAPAALTDLGITDGTSGQVLTTDGSAGFTFASASSSTTLGGVGTYAFLMRTSTAQTSYINVGSTYSGSSLTYAGVSRSAGNNIIISPRGTPSGTWRAMGHVGPAFGGFNQRATSFVRIS